jgi:hypothetical protein
VPAPSTPLPPIPDGPAAPKTLDAGGYSDVEQTHALLENGDKGASLTAIKTNAEVAGDFVQSHAWARTPTDWEGDAARAAFTSLNSFNEWLGELAGAWKRLGDAAAKIKHAHDVAYTQHTTIWIDYLQLKNELATLMATPHGVGESVRVQADVQQLYAKMAVQQRKSDELRQTYSQDSHFDPVRVARPPFSSGGTSASAGAPGGHGDAVGANAGGGRAGGGTAGATGTSPPSTSPSSASPAGDGTRAGGEGASGSGTPSGGSGSPSGGGSPAGSPSGSPGGGLGGGSGVPTMPAGPALHPAAASLGGGAGGGSGGGLGSAPLQPSVASKSVGPGTAGGVGGAGLAPAAAAGSPGGAMGGGMGGAPMGHGQAPSGKEKRRTPGLSPDEDLYVEDREHTEEVIGARKRRTLQEPRDPS